MICILGRESWGRESDQAPGGASASAQWGMHGFRVSQPPPRGNYLYAGPRNPFIVPRGASTEEADRYYIIDTLYVQRLIACQARAPLGRQQGRHRTAGVNAQSEQQPF